MDKLMNNHWAMKIIALLLALMLFMSIHLEAQPKQKDSGLFVPTTDTETVNDVPVMSYFDNNKFVVAGIPQVVNVTLTGPNSAIKPAKLQHDFEIYVDLRDYGVGKHKVKLKYRNISNKLTVDIEPKEAIVVIQEKVTKEFPVDVDLIREEMIKDGYSVEKPIIKPNVVKVTGAKEEIDNISFVEARVDLQNASDTIKQDSKVAAYDGNGNIVNVEIDPAVVEVTVPITSPSKVVPIKINRKGKLKDNLSIVSIEPTPSEVTIYGSKDSLDKIDMIDDISIDLDDISGDTELEIPVPKPDGVKKVSPEKIKVKVKVDEQIKKTLTSIPISIDGLSENQEALISDPVNAMMDIDIFGAKNVIDKVKPSDIKIFVNAKDLEIGEYPLDLEVSGPQNISWEIPKNTATVVISNKGE